MTNVWIKIGREDCERGMLYATGLPIRPNATLLANYRAGWIAAEYEAGDCDLPALVAQGESGASYCVVAIDEGKPVFNVWPRGEARPTSGYFDLASLLSLRNDRLMSR